MTYAEQMRRVSLAIDAVRRGEIVVVLDDAERENEGDLIMAAERATAERLAFFIRHTSGLVCVALDTGRCGALELPLMVSDNQDRFTTAFTTSVDCVDVAGSGVSPADRALTIHALVDERTRPSDLARPGHLFPLRARRHGVLDRPGHTEAAMDLARLAGFAPAGVLAEVVNPDGSMARAQELRRFSELHGLVMLSIADLIVYRNLTEPVVRRVATKALRVQNLDVEVHIVEHIATGERALAVVHGDVIGQSSVPVVATQVCFLGLAFGRQGCDCGELLPATLAGLRSLSGGVAVCPLPHGELASRCGDPTGRELLCHQVATFLGVTDPVVVPAPGILAGGPLNEVSRSSGVGLPELLSLVSV